MRQFIVAATLALAIAGAAASPTPAAAQQTAIPRNSNVDVQYVGFRYQELYDRLRKRQILEELGQFLSPLRLQQKLTIRTTTCGVVNSFYDYTTHAINLCYELLDMIENGAAVPASKLPPPPDPKTPLGLIPGVTRAEAIVGGIVGVALHETGHAVFDIQQVPRLGREEDAADMIAGFIMLQFGNDVTRTMVKGTYNLMRHMYASNPSIDYNSMADVHSLNMQRAYNYLCLAYGKDAASIKDLADAWLPPARKPDCANEYQQALSAFDKTIMPSVDQTLLAKVRGMQILRADDSKL